MWNIVDILVILRLCTSIYFIVFALVFYFFACFDAFFIPVNQCIVTSNLTWKHFGDYSGTCGECTLITFVDILLELVF